MYNQELLDIMDDVNAMAKSMGYANGLAWAWEQVENDKLSKTEFEYFEDCHNLRNLIAHGCSKDIHLSEGTKLKAIRFMFAIKDRYVYYGEQVKESFLRPTNNDDYNYDLPF